MLSFECVCGVFALLVIFDSVGMWLRWLGCVVWLWFLCDLGVGGCLSLVGCCCLCWWLVTLVVLVCLL